MSRKLRQEALEWAAGVMKGCEQDMQRMWAWAVFYETFIVNGADGANRMMSIAPPGAVVEFKIVEGAARRDLLP